MNETALRVYADLGAIGARFDRRGVAAAMRTASGRRHVAAQVAAARASLLRRLGQFSGTAPRPRQRAARRRGGAGTSRRAQARGSAGRQEPPPDPPHPAQGAVRAAGDDPCGGR